MTFMFSLTKVSEDQLHLYLSIDRSQNQTEAGHFGYDTCNKFFNLKIFPKDLRSTFARNRS